MFSKGHVLTVAVDQLKLNVPFSPIKTAVINALQKDYFEFLLTKNGPITHSEFWTPPSFIYNPFGWGVDLKFEVTGGGIYPKFEDAKLELNPSGLGFHFFPIIRHLRVVQRKVSKWYIDIEADALAIGNLCGSLVRKELPEESACFKFAAPKPYTDVNVYYIYINHIWSDEEEKQFRNKVHDEFQIGLQGGLTEGVEIKESVVWDEIQKNLKSVKLLEPRFTRFGFGGAGNSLNVMTGFKFKLAI